MVAYVEGSIPRSCHEQVPRIVGLKSCASDVRLMLRMLCSVLLQDLDSPQERRCHFELLS